MIVIPPHAQAGTAGKPGSQFSGEVHPYLTMPATDGVTINTVNFSPRARTYWHHHERGQVLLVVAGRGLVQAEGSPVQVIRAGDTVWAPPGERHWHGASPDSYVVHVAISLGQTSWEEAVSDEAYLSAPITGNLSAPTTGET
ncbi:MAG TPA: cupin domain-containing protein [Acidimicrobiales bacterium]|nr:cupin domain-containing protein [Acidimicrobiales bacterium]